MIGLFGRRNLSLSDIKVWQKSELRPEGGTIQALREWRVGKTGNVTMPVVRLLADRVNLAVKSAVEMRAAGKIVISRAAKA
jgi:hypothetical protein